MMTHCGFFAHFIGCLLWLAASTSVAAYGQEILPRNVQLPAANASPQDVYLMWRRAMTDGRIDTAWELLSPQMRDMLTAELFALGELGGESERKLVAEHIRPDGNEAEIAKRRALREGRPPTENEMRSDWLSTLKNPKNFFVAGYAHLAKAQANSKPAPPIPALKMITQGTWARGSHLRNGCHRENIDFALTPSGWRIERIWEENVPNPDDATGYARPKGTAFANPQQVYDTYVKARLSADWETCWSCFTPRLKDQAAYDGLYDLSQHDPHFEKIYLAEGFKQPSATSTPLERRRQLLNGLRDKFTCYAAARSFQCGRDKDEWQEPLREVVVSGEQARGLVTRKYSTLRREGGMVSNTYETVDTQVYFKKMSAGWLIDVAPSSGGP